RVVVNEKVQVYGIFKDITEHKRAEEALRESEVKFRNIIEQSSDAIYLLFEDRFEIINRRFTEMFGVTKKEALSPEFDFMQLVAPESHDLIRERGMMQKRGEAPPVHYEFTALDKWGNFINVEASVKKIDYRGGSAVQGILRDVSERKVLEEQLRQSQKMEGIGRLAGGVAHDFNNLLTVIMGESDMMAMTLDKLDPLMKDISEIQEATRRAADLTRQLLAFSRKQTLQPNTINLRDTVKSMHKMLVRVIGEDINLQTFSADDLWNVEADPGQIEHVIVNLTVNARDAMPDGGSLTIETENVELDAEYARHHPSVESGPYVMLAVSDTGAGMTPEVQAQIFEPFYTTKEVGKGTGLGLSTVFGIIMQSGGHIWVYSEVGDGTTFKIYLPMIEDEAETYIGKSDADKLPHGTETILLVEDEEKVRRLSCRILNKLGYNVLEAESGSEALKMCEEMDKPVDLVLTDVIMPGIKGSEMVRKLQEIWKEFKVLYMSGYTSNAIVHSGVLDAGTPYLQKPFHPADLAMKVRSILDS
ncbi:ATP-binding protein, partial [Calditrichota bacterium]